MEKKGRLCLTRRPMGKRIRITTPDNTEIWIGVSKIRPDRGVITIEADKDVEILREELIKE